MATRKQKLVIPKIMENHGNLSKSMREVGYSKNTAKNPKNLTDSKGFKELMGDFLPDTLVLQRHQEIVEEGEDKDAVRAIDMAYKLKGNYAPEKHINLNVEPKASDRIRAIADRLVYRNG